MFTLLLVPGTPGRAIIAFDPVPASTSNEEERPALRIDRQFQQFIGVPAYTSPEQAEMSTLDIDTRADIHSLRVLPYWSPGRRARSSVELRNQRAMAA